MSDFSGQQTIPFAMGSLTGIRCWRVSGDGTLQAVNHTYRYTNAENKAHCAMGLPSRHIEVEMGRGMGVRTIDHHPGVYWCSCGFYGYYSGEAYTTNQYAGYETITGLVQAYGRCSYGKNGFRAEKLKILAIVNPFLTEREVQEQARADRTQALRKKMPPKVPWRRRIKAWYFRKWHPFVLPALLAIGFIFCSSTSGSRESDQGKVLQVLLGVSLFALAMAMFHVAVKHKTATGLRNILGQSERIEQTPECLLPGNTSLTKRDYERVKTRYPDVPHYRSVEEALQIFPLTDYYQDTPGGRKRR